MTCIIGRLNISSGRMLPQHEKHTSRLETRINAAGITTRRNYINTERGPVPVLIAEHGYIGPYPTREARDKLDTVRGICARYNVRRELRGYYQATYIREEVTPA